MHVTRWRSPGENFLMACFSFKANGIRKRIIKRYNEVYRGDCIFLDNSIMRNQCKIGFARSPICSTFLIDSSSNNPFLHFVF